MLPHRPQPPDAERPGTRQDPNGIQTAETLILEGDSGAVTAGSGEARDFESPEHAALFFELRAALAPRFQIARPLGVGGMGAVYLGFDPLLKRAICVKVLLPSTFEDETARMRFVREAEAAASVAHPNVVNVFDVGTLPHGAPYFVMQFVDGVDLATQLALGQAIAEPQAKRVVGEVAAALAAAHARGVIHRDIKPRNVLIERDTGRAVVVDFGISAVVGARRATGATGGTGADGTVGAVGTAAGPHETATEHGETNIYLGTPTYTSPEHAQGLPLTGKSDVYSLGVLAFELATGKTPFTAKNNYEMLIAHISRDPRKVHELRPDLDREFADLIDRCLDKAPEARPSAADIAKALIPDAHPAIEWPPPGLDVLRRRGRHLRNALLFAALCAAAFLFVLALEPSTDSAQWDRPERSALWTHLSTGRLALDATAAAPSDDEAPAVWFFLVTLAGAATAIAVGSAFAATVRCGLATRDALSAGYPGGVVTDVVTDWWPSSRALRNSTGAFALIGTPACEALLVQRRRAAGRLVAGLALLCVAPWGWIAGLFGGWVHAPESFPPPELLLAVAPALVALILVAVARAPEWRFMARARATWTLTPQSLWRSSVTARPEVIASWMRAAREPRPKRNWRRVANVPLIVGGVVAGVIAAGTTASCAALIAMFAGVTHDLHEARHDAFDWATSYKHDHLRYSTIDSTLDRIEHAGSAAETRASSVRRRLAAARADLASPHFGEMLRGEVEALAVARQLAAAGTADHDSASLNDAVALAQLVAHLREAHPTSASARAIMADPHEPTGYALIADTTLMPAARAYLAFEGLPEGYCADARELLFGVDEHRGALVRRAGLMLRGIPGADSLARSAERRVARLHDSSSADVHSNVGAPAWLAPLRWFGLGGVSNRLVGCVREDRAGAHG